MHTSLPSAPVLVPQDLQPPYWEILSQTAHLLLQDSDPDTLCQVVFDILRSRFPIDAYFHYLVSPDGTHLEMASSGGSEPIRAFLGTPLQFGQAVCGTVAQRRESMYLTNIHRRTDEMTSLVRSLGIYSYASYPLIVRGHLIGTLSIGSTVHREFQPEELALYAVVAQQVAAASDRLAQNQHMREMERLAVMGRLGASLAHEIRNPLDTIGNVLHLLRYHVHTPAARDLLLNAQDELARLSDAAQRALYPFRARNEPQRVDLSQLAADLIADIRLQHHTRLRSAIEPGLQVFAITGELRQVLFNLLMNASNSSPLGEEVTLTLRRAGSRVELRVKDAGPGIPREDRANLFQPFYAAQARDGGGVGLWISHEIIARIGGTLTFVAEESHQPGAEFVATLPLVN